MNQRESTRFSLLAMARLLRWRLLLLLFTAGAAGLLAARGQMARVAGPESEGTPLGAQHLALVINDSAPESPAAAPGSAL